MRKFKFLCDKGRHWLSALPTFFQEVSFPHEKHKIHNPAFSLAQEAQRKSLAKRKRRIMGLLAPSPRKFFEKNLTKNFPLWCGANIMRSIVERSNYDKKISPPVSKFLKDGGVGEEKLFLKSFLPPRENQKNKGGKE